MKLLETTLRLSPSDLPNHLACVHLTALDLAVAQGTLVRPTAHSQFLEVLQARGLEHEKAYVDSLRQTGLTVVDLTGRKLTDDGFGETRAAMAAGADAIVQAPLGHDGWAGYADVLLRVNEPSGLGHWSYEVVDTKLARETRGGTILQLWVYSDIVSAIQGRRPERFHVVTPGDPFVHEAYRLDDFAAYYRLVKARLESAVAGSGETYPEPTPHCDICRWWAPCTARRRADDHLSLVAGIRRLQIDELYRHDVRTLTALAGVSVPLPFAPQRGSREAMVRAREQARVQLLGHTTGRPEHELLPLEANRGLHRLPAPSQGDIFLDLEGDPFAGTSGLEYLFGWATRADGGTWRYERRWALGAEEEKAAFEAFIAFAVEGLARHPDLHIYHYAPYEPSALKRLMGRYGVCGDELDRLLRGSTLVDLYAIVRQSLRASVERYSIKELEPFYGFARETPLRETSQALRQVEYLLETNQPLPEDDPLRAQVASYNRDDCLSAAGLRDWLEQLHAGVIASGQAVPRPTPHTGTATEKVTARDLRTQALVDRLVVGIPVDRDDRSPAQHAQWLLAQLLGFHRREDKAVWWEFFRLTDLEDEALLDEKEALVGLQFVGRVDATKKTVTNRYTFPPQEVDIGEDAELLTSATHKVGTLAALDRDARTLDIKHLVTTASERPTTVISRRIFATDVMAESLFGLGEWVADHGIEGPGPYRVGGRLLLRDPPLLSSGTLGQNDGEDEIARACRVALALDETTLAIQGPPGAGKTFTGAQMICELVRVGRTVGVCATGHKVIRHQIEAALKAAVERGVSLRCVHKPKELSDQPGVVREVDSNEDVLEILDGREADVVGGTAWLWARPEMQGKLDVLVIDEAGQMSLANVLAVSQAARSVILLGDPQQLEQPLKGTHPDGAASSVLQHVLGEHQTLPPERGLFIAETRRLAPAICAFTSELFYEGRLRSHPGLERQALNGPDGLTGAGLWFIPVVHDGNQNVSLEEVDVVARLVARLIETGSTWVDASGETHALTLDDILIVAPYNAQVYAIRSALEARGYAGARAGTVDRFQGQQAPVVLYSLTTSSAEDAPRGMEFLYSLNRLNVATSRARCAAIVIASPRLFEPDCQTPRQMKLANGLCRFREMARGWTG